MKYLYYSDYFDFSFCKKKKNKIIFLSNNLSKLKGLSNNFFDDEERYILIKNHLMKHKIIDYEIKTVEAGEFFNFILEEKKLISNKLKGINKTNYLLNKFYNLNKETEIIKSSPLLRNDNLYLTFSPFLDTENNFKKNEKRKIMKVQKTIRYINKMDLTNPLALNTQLTFAIQDYFKKNQVSNIINILENLEKTYLLKTENIIIHSDAKTIKKIIKKNKYNTNVIENVSAHLNISGVHKYVKIGYKYRNQEVIIGNFVLVDIDKKNNDSKLDSIFYPERLEMIMEKKSYIFDIQKYKEIDFFDLNNWQRHRVINDFITILTLMSLGVEISNKGIGNELKRKIKNLYVFLSFICNKKNIIDYINNNKKNILEICFAINIEYNEKSIKNIVDYIKFIEIDLRKKINSIPNINNISKDYLKDTLGIPNEFFNQKVIISKTKYNFKE